jgi:3-hydroxy-3-methylglutaryl CoA synthase/uncharacterized OB-fold protein
LIDRPPGIKDCGAYLPRLRIERAAIGAATGWAGAPGRSPRGQRSFCNWDEDSLTMAVEAARDCVRDIDRSTIGWMGLASTTLPFADRSNAAVAATALNLRADCATLDFGSSRRAGTGALLTALDRSSSADDALVMAADRRIARPGSEQELAYGHGAAAVLVGRGSGLIAELVGHASIAEDFVDQHRESGREFDYALEERWIRDEGHLKLLPRVIDAALARAGVGAQGIAHFIAPTAVRTTQAIARASGLPASSIVDDLRDACGDTGTAHPLLLLSGCLERAAPGELILVTSFGQGCDAVLLRAADGIRSTRRGGLDASLASGLPDPEYLRFLSHCGVIEMDWGMRAERDNRTAQTVAWRRRREVTGFIGGRCGSCGTVQYPRTRACVNPGCRAFDTQASHPLADSGGSVKTFTEDWLAFTRRPPLAYGNVAFDGGGNLFTEFTDTQPGELAVGTQVRFVFRIKDIDPIRGFRRYFWKAAVARH